MIDALNNSQRRVLAIAILLLAMTVLLGITALPVLLAAKTNNATISSMENRLASLRQAATVSNGLRTRFEQLSRWQSGNRQYLKSNSVELAAAELERLVKRHAVTSDIDIISTQIITARRDETAIPVTLKVRMAGDLDNVVQLFHALETGEPYLFLDNILIKTNRGGGRRVKNRRRSLGIDTEITGYMQGAS